ncbi:MAG: hypothetical protein A3F74_26735 [Betaproteobacteria bacterium RIFCSPLOWO2_12_FULL_62_58]|nr:MAG: hypothetical protein A3F74_26735 [Betaproteobacteria bacterium RIFCSPLOWO2_12_FULL_62_58]
MRYIICTLVAAVVFISAGIGSVASQDQDKTGRVVKREIIPGSELMTPAEREQYRQRIRGARSADDEARVRAEHKKLVEERARLRGLRVADPASPDMRK